MSDFGVYIHLPFCLSRCGYCDFSVVTDKDDSQSAYVSALENELEFWRERVIDAPISLYFGGGTPSRLRPEFWTRLIEKFADLFGLTPEMEISCEANPESASAEILSLWKDSGVNRISLGVQTFRPEHLSNLDRRHDPQEAIAAVERIREAGFDNWSLDLIYGLPGQTLDEWKADLKIALSLEPPHLSFYNLILHPGHPTTEKAEAAMTPNSEDIQSEMFLLACETLQSNGFEVYELSNAAKPGRACRHNLLYWRGGEWLGLGMSGSSFFWKSYFHNPKVWPIYLNAWESVPSDLPFKVKQASWEAQLLDFVMLRLRTSEGFMIAELEDLLGRNVGIDFRRLLLEMKNHGYTQSDEDRVALTPPGWLVHSEITSRILECLLRKEA
ncbi:MAG: radical SAM family heme chaperone HemW [Candidatus Omnitrophica bacterium]|nr:radical SAM family heme chaperone HemW [Candidatus Omnitrophota bacterium]